MALSVRLEPQQSPARAGTNHQVPEAELGVHLRELEVLVVGQPSGGRNLRGNRASQQVNIGSSGVNPRRKHAQ